MISFYASEPKPPLKPGDYSFKVRNAEEKMSSNSNEMIELKLDVYEGTYQSGNGSTVYDNLVFTAKSAWKTDNSLKSCDRHPGEDVEVTLGCGDSGKRLRRAKSHLNAKEFHQPDLCRPPMPWTRRTDRARDRGLTHQRFLIHSPLQPMSPVFHHSSGPTRPRISRFGHKKLWANQRNPQFSVSKQRRCTVSYGGKR